MAKHDAKGRSKGDQPHFRLYKWFADTEAWRDLTPAERCVYIELELRGIPFVAQQKLDLEYKGRKLQRTYSPDFICYDKIILVRESGTYQINGGTLSIKPQKSVIQAWSKLGGGDKFGKLLTTQNRKLEAVNYRFTKHYFSGIDQWQLVLQADSPTDRDGPYSTFTVFPNAWYYATISNTNPLIELPAGR